MDWTEESEARLLIVKLRGEIDLHHSPKMRQLLQNKACAKVPSLLLDFTEVKYIDSSGLATLVEYYKNSRGYSGQFAVTGLNPRLRSIFDLVRLSEVFGIYATVAEAREAMVAKT